MAKVERIIIDNCIAEKDEASSLPEGGVYNTSVKADGELKCIVNRLDKLESLSQNQTHDFEFLQQKHLKVVLENAQLEQRLLSMKQQLDQAERDKALLDAHLRKASIQLGIHERSNSCNETALAAACDANKQLETHLIKVETFHRALVDKYDKQQAHLSSAEDNIYQLTEDKFVLSQNKAELEGRYAVLSERLNQTDVEL